MKNNHAHLKMSHFETMPFFGIDRLCAIHENSLYLEVTWNRRCKYLVQDELTESESSVEKLILNAIKPANVSANQYLEETLLKAPGLFDAFSSQKANEELGRIFELWPTTNPLIQVARIYSFLWFIAAVYKPKSNSLIAKMLSAINSDLSPKTKLHVKLHSLGFMAYRLGFDLTLILNRAVKASRKTDMTPEECLQAISLFSVAISRFGKSPRLTVDAFGDVLVGMYDSINSAFCTPLNLRCKTPEEFFEFYNLKMEFWNLRLEKVPAPNQCLELTRSIFLNFGLGDSQDLTLCAALLANCSGNQVALAEALYVEQKSVGF